jgi:hypothetical protein
MVGGNEVESNHLFYDLVYYIPGNLTPIIVSDFNNFEQEQYISFNIPYRVFIYDKNTYDVKFYEDDVLIKELTVDSSLQY